MSRRLQVGRWSVVVYPVDCAMHGAVNIGTPVGWLCFKLTTRAYAGLRPWYVYWSPNATPWAATFACGPGVERRERQMAPVRRALFGWRGSPDVSGRINEAINEVLYLERKVKQAQARSTRSAADRIERGEHIQRKPRESDG